MADIDIKALVDAMQDAASKAIGNDVSQLKGFSQQQLTAIAQQSADVAAGIADGSITPNDRDFFLNSIKEMARSFANTLAGLATVMIEEVWNAVVQIVWGAINKATGLALAAA